MCELMQLTLHLVALVLLEPLGASPVPGPHWVLLLVQLWPFPHRGGIPVQLLSPEAVPTTEPLFPKQEHGVLLTSSSGRWLCCQREDVLNLILPRVEPLACGRLSPTFLPHLEWDLTDRPLSSNWLGPQSSSRHHLCDSKWSAKHEPSAWREGLGTQLLQPWPGRVLHFQWSSIRSLQPTPLLQPRDPLLHLARLVLQPRQPLLQPLRHPGGSSLHRRHRSNRTVPVDWPATVLSFQTLFLSRMIFPLTCRSPSMPLSFLSWPGDTRSCCASFLLLSWADGASIQALTDVQILQAWPLLGPALRSSLPQTRHQLTFHEDGDSLSCSRRIRGSFYEIQETSSPLSAHFLPWLLTLDFSSRVFLWTQCSFPGGQIDELAFVVGVLCGPVLVRHCLFPSLPLQSPDLLPSSSGNTHGFPRREASWLLGLGLSRFQDG